MSCIFCPEAGVVTSSGHYVCGDKNCQDNYKIKHYNNSLTTAFYNNPKEVEFMIRITFKTALYRNRNVVFDPFPRFFNKTKKNNYEYVENIVKNTSERTIILTLTEYQNDKDVRYKLREQTGNNDLFKLLKFIIATKNINTDYVELSLGKMGVLNQFKIKHSPEIEDKFMKSDDGFHYLFHGSNIANWHSIIRNGIYVASGTKLMRNGAAHGNGVYLSDNLAINSFYCENRSSTFIVAVYLVSGNISNYRKAPEIFVVPSASNLLLKYLIEIPSRALLSELSPIIVDHFNNLHQTQIKARENISKRTKARINYDIKKLNNLTVTIVEQAYDQYSVVTKNGVINIKFMTEYPFEPPIIWVTQNYKDCEIINGCVAYPDLLKSKWRPTININDMITEIINKMNIPLDEYYDEKTAENVCMIYRNN